MSEPPVSRKAGISSVVWLAAGTIALCSGACSMAPRPTASAAPITLTIGFPYAAEEDASRGVRQAARLASLEGLSTQSLNGRPVPRLAENWTESTDGLTWAIRLRPSAVFHDGSAVDASAVKRSLERYLATGAGRASAGLQDISSIEASEPYLLTLRLKQRSTLLIDDLETPITKLDDKGTTIGTGPYLISSMSATEVVMTAFAHHYSGQATVDRLVWRLFPTVRTAWAATMRGEVDFLYEVGPETREFLQSEGSVQLYSFQRAYVYGAIFNTRRPVFKEAEVRKALNYAIDRKSIVERAFRGHATPASGPAWPLHWAYDESASEYEYEPARAAASLQKIFSKDRVENNRPGVLKFACLIPQNFQLWERLALMVQRDLAEIGVDMTLEAVPVDTFNQRIASGDFDVVLMETVSGTSVNRPLSFWHSLGLHNFSGYQNASVDSALEAVRRAPGESEYREGFRRFQREVFDDPPAIFLAWGETARAVSRRFDVVKAPGGDIRMTISDWTLADRRARSPIEADHVALRAAPSCCRDPAPSRLRRRLDLLPPRCNQTIGDHGQRERCQARR